MKFLLPTLFLLALSLSMVGQGKTAANAQACPVMTIEGVQLGMTTGETATASGALDLVCGWSEF